MNGHYLSYLAKKMCVIPLRQGRPLVEWSRYYNDLPDASEVSTWNSPEMAILCGEVSGLIALDIDTDNNAQRIYDFAGHTPVRKFGSKGFTAFYRYNGERSCVWKQDKVVVCEILSNKRLTTIPPSPHRVTGKAYEWMDGCGLLDGVELPAISSDFFVIMDALYPRPVRASQAIMHEIPRNPVSLAQAADMLDYISSDCPRDEWITIGMALRDEFGDAACSLWHDWSAKAKDRYNREAAQACWRSFHSTGVTIGTIVHFAKQGGWMPIYESDNYFEVGIEYVQSLVDKKRKEMEASKTGVVEDAAEETLRVGGMVGDIADWITSTAIRPQPILSLSAALAFVGMLKGHRVRGKTNLRTNIMTLSLAPTAAGKEYPQYAIDKLATVCGLGNHMLGRPTSGTALLTGLQRAGCVGLLSVDEIGRFFGNISMKNSGGYQREIIDYMIELFSRAGGTFRGRQYANEKINPRVVLENPHLCCVGSTVPERLQAACTSEEVIDGFLNRWLVFSSSQRPEKQRGVNEYEPPAWLVEKIKEWASNHPSESPKEVSMTKEAWEMFISFEDEMTRKLDATPYPMNMLYARAAEHAEKAAMILCDDDVIGTQEMASAIIIVNQSNCFMRAFAEGITSSDHERKLLLVADVIKRSGSLSRNELTQRTRQLNNKERADIVNQLAEAGDILVEKDGKKVTIIWA